MMELFSPICSIDDGFYELNDRLNSLIELEFTSHLIFIYN